MHAKVIENVRHYITAADVQLNAKDVMRIFKLTEYQVLSLTKKSIKIGDTTLISVDGFFGLIHKLDTDQT